MTVDALEKGFEDSIHHCCNCINPLGLIKGKTRDYWSPHTIVWILITKSEQMSLILFVNE